jgi:hypothetical protein
MIIATLTWTVTVIFDRRVALFMGTPSGSQRAAHPSKGCGGGPLSEQVEAAAVLGIPGQFPPE